MVTTYGFEPDYAIPPGETLREVLSEKNMSQSDLALRTGLTEKTISQIINGVAPISYETAARFELALDVPARFWNARESQYREALIRKKELKSLDAEREWLELIPVGVLKVRKCIPPNSDRGATVKDVLRFFQVSSIEAWKNVWQAPQVQFRGAQALQRKPGYVAAWVRIGEIVADKIECSAYDEKKFKAALNMIRVFTIEKASEWRPKLTKLCAEAGVAVVLVPEVPGAGVSGVTKWMSPDKAIIMLSLRYRTDDQFWFTFFHEACHVLKHSKKSVFYEDGADCNSPEEKEANKFARDILIPPQHAMRLPYVQHKKIKIKEFAEHIGVSPGIVVGRLQHDRLLPMSFCNDLKVKFVWADPSRANQNDES